MRFNNSAIIYKKEVKGLPHRQQNKSDKGGAGILR